MKLIRNAAMGIAVLLLASALSGIAYADGSATDFEKSEALWKLAEEHSAKGDVEQALAYGRQSVALLPESEVRNLQMAYLALRHGRDREATIYFERGLKNWDPASGANENAVLDAAYAHKRLGANEKVRIYLERAIDALSQKVASSPEPAREDVERLYDARREHADLTRKWGWNTGLFYLDPGGRRGYSFQGLTELYWQPYYENGKQLQIYAQLGETFASEHFMDGADTAYAVLGARYEPLGEHNLVLALERFFEIGDATRNDTRARIGYSWDTGLELEPYVPSWKYVTFFNEYVYSLEHAYSLYYGEFRLGRSFRPGGLGGRLAVSPHFVAAWNYDSEAQTDWNTYAGAGVHFRKWYREDKYNAPKSYLDVVLQYRFGLSGDGGDRLVLTLLNAF